MNSSMPDEIIVQNILEGDDNAFAHLYERYRPLIFSAVGVIIRDPEGARDAAQEIFLKLYRHLHQWNAEKSRLSTWIYRMAVNHAIDCRRSRLRRAESQLPGNGSRPVLRPLTEGNDAYSPFKAVQNREEISLVRRYLETLPAIQKKTFKNRYFHGLKLAEIAEMECCNLGTIKSSLYRATRAVRQLLLKSRDVALRKMESPA
jgi:RNA polymerase sigma factor (sigma-70 family)